MRFYLVRHGKTEFNLARRFQGGAVDSPLLPESIINAQKVGSYLADLKFAGAFASPQERAVVTAQRVLVTAGKHSFFGSVDHCGSACSVDRG